MKAFTGTFTFKVDKKGRVSVPADYRALLAQQAGDGDNGLLVFPWFPYRALRGCGLELIDRIAQQRAPEAVFNNTPLDNAQMSAADMVSLPFDSEGRIILPRDLAEHCGVSDSATFVGLINFFEIWEPSAFKANQAARRALANPAPGV